MIEKMRYVVITGPIEHINWAIEHYLMRHKVHLEYAIQQLFDINPIEEDNPYQELTPHADFFLKLLKDEALIYFPMTGKQAKDTLEQAVQRYNAKSQHFKGLEAERDRLVKLLPFTPLDVSKLDKLKHFKCSFGSMPIKRFMQFETFVYEETPVIFAETFRDKDNIWGCFITPAGPGSNTELAAYSFEPAFIPEGAPENIEERLREVENRLSEMALEDIPEKNALLAACCAVKSLHQVFTIKQYAAGTKEHYIFAGWMPLTEAKVLEREVKDDDKIIFTHTDGNGEGHNGLIPPTKLKNPPVLHWFEFFVKLYGLPKYTEIDPTPVLAVAYILLFGLMFGDVGHGLGVALIGYYLLTGSRSKSQIGGIMIAAGLSASVFGLLYGSIFGIEDLIPALWRHPIHNITETLYFAVYLGVGIIVIAMVLNMVNAFKQKDYERLFFSPNGIVGMFLYITILAAFTGLIPWLFVIVPLSAILIKYKLGALEILLAYLTNTISFVRVGAFALSHAGMMHVVLMLSQNAAGSRNLLVLILGNLLVMSVEGLLIGIQSLRLGFYELFSRFYEGGGRKFEPQNSTISNEAGFSR